mmetsp:Transcript_113216/g.365833  ORF Transcript_113216/g.365833 Transcript_113216/m.365833 type:complete len:545 (-) Transcript_113216:101-1735(-)
MEPDTAAYERPWPRPTPRPVSGMRLVCFCACLARSAAKPESSLGKLRWAQQRLEAVFVGEGSAEQLVDAYEALQEVGALTARSIRDSSRGVHSAGHELSAEDVEAAQAYIDEKVFVLMDVLPLVVIPLEALATTLEENWRQPTCCLWRVVAALRYSWWDMLTSKSFMWAVPFFGALNSAASRLRRAEYPSDPYREALLARNAETHLHHQALSGTLSLWGYSRSDAFRRACACLALADGRAMVEAAERHFKAFEHNSLRIVLEHAAEWPLFELLRSLAVKAPALRETPNLSIAPLPEVQTSWATPMTSGQQRLAPAEALELYRMLHVVARLCDALGVLWWVSHGTLIGALRDGGLSLHADDCEVDVSEADVEVFQGPSMRRALARNGYELSYDPRGRCFKVWPAGSPQAPQTEDQLMDQSWWLPQQRVGSPSLDVYLVQSPVDNVEQRYYISNEEYHCNAKVCTQVWKDVELGAFQEVPFGLSRVKVPVGAPAYLTRVYGHDWNTTVRAHGWVARLGLGFEPLDVARLTRRAAGPCGPLIAPVLP